MMIASKMRNAFSFLSRNKILRMDCMMKNILIVRLHIIILIQFVWMYSIYVYMTFPFIFVLFRVSFVPSWRNESVARLTSLKYGKCTCQKILSFFLMLKMHACIRRLTGEPINRILSWIPLYILLKFGCSLQTSSVRQLKLLLTVYIYKLLLLSWRFAVTWFLQVEGDNNLYILKVNHNFSSSST